MRLFFVFLFIFYSCSNNPDDLKDFFPQENLPVEIVEEAEMVHTQSGVFKSIYSISYNLKFQNTTLSMNHFS